MRTHPRIQKPTYLHTHVRQNGDLERERTAQTHGEVVPPWGPPKIVVQRRGREQKRKEGESDRHTPFRHPIKGPGPSRLSCALPACRLRIPASVKPARSFLRQSLHKPFGPSSPRHRLVRRRRRRSLYWPRKLTLAQRIPLPSLSFSPSSFSAPGALSRSRSRVGPDERSSASL